MPTITWRGYDRATGAVIRRIDDAEPSLLLDPPSGWSAPGFGGEHFVFDFVIDAQGRPLRTIEPEHNALVGGDDSGADLQSADSALASTKACPLRQFAKLPHAEPTLLRRVTYNLYLDNRHQTWTASGYVTGYGSREESWHLLGPISIDRRDAADRPLDSIEARPACACGALSIASLGEIDAATELPDRLLWSRWTHTLRDLWGRDTGSRAYTKIPLENGSLGLEGEHCRLTLMGFDVMNRPNLLVAAYGTITRSVIDLRDLPTAVWIGTDDAGATDTDPGNSGAGGNNMKPFDLLQYDGGNAGGNGHLTEQRQPVDDTAGNDRVTQHSSDFRNRRIQTDRNDGTRLLIRAFAYDNLDQQISETAYHTSVANGNRTAFSETKKDLRKRGYETKTWGVNTSSGALTDALIAGTWYDPNGNPIVETEAGSGKATKTSFNSRNQPEVIYEVDPGTPPGGAAGNDVSDDVVAQQRELEFDRGNDFVLITTRRRLHDATGKGPQNDSPLGVPTFSTG